MVELDAAVLDDALTEMWNRNGAQRLRHVGYPLGRFGRLRSIEYQRRFQLRSLLVIEAVDCHREKRYAAATALTLAQIDGLTTDVMGSTFFRHEPDAGAPAYTDDDTLAGIDGNLPVVRASFSAPVDVTARHGSISRHGILHGRDLTYATQTTSTKALVLLGALVERLQAPAQERARLERRRTDIEQMKLDGVDERGRLLDARCLPETYMFRADLSTDVHSTMMSESLSEHMLIQSAHRRLKERGLHRGSFQLLDVGARRFAWSFRLPSGHYLGASHDMVKATVPVEVAEFTWDAPMAPVAAPWTDESGWTAVPFGTPQTLNWDAPKFFA
ncbi:hypothetical protein [Plantibacter sp. CFBP 8775]|uniref:hypothetical protein n=1 Tax=Plantibacter sp. CFBP 8775 TaxID=2774038 RepID=UPI00177EF98A|nr:hypothetical protein [Plantibacter sp. CFBP 8775]MBD8102286.1 hypothetical protein [Plantibacter sp. CFBP 8775]